MILIFTIPKPFEGHIKTIQYNAIKSWTLLHPDVKVLLLGDEHGTEEMVRNLGTLHIPEIARNDHGTPLVSDMFAKARSIGSDILCYVNADIILTADLLNAAETLSRKKQSFLMIGQRWDVDITEQVDFSDGWQQRIRTKVTTDGKPHEETGIDYFVFTKDLFTRIPDFAVGRSAWDNWLIFSARSQRAAVVDATASVLAVHQNHDYAHVPAGEYGAWKGPEARRNLALAGGFPHCFTIMDSTHVFRNGTLRPAHDLKYLKRYLTAWIILHDRLYRISKIIQSWLGMSPQATWSSEDLHKS